LGSGKGVWRDGEGKEGRTYSAPTLTLSIENFTGMHGGLPSSLGVSVAARRDHFTTNLLPTLSVKAQFKDRSILREVTANVEL